MSQKFYSTGQAAKLCGVAIRTVADWCDRGLLVSFRIPGSRHRRIEHDQLMKFVQEHHIPAKLDETDPTNELYKLRRIIYHLATDPSRMVYSQRERVKQIVAEFNAMYPPVDTELQAHTIPLVQHGSEARKQREASPLDLDCGAIQGHVQ